MREPESGGDARHALGLAGIGAGGRQPGGDRAEAAGAGADGAEQHERDVPPGPALGPIRTARLLADAVQARAAQLAFQRLGRFGRTALAHAMGGQPARRRLPALPEPIWIRGDCTGNPLRNDENYWRMRNSSKRPGGRHAAA